MSFYGILILIFIFFIRLLPEIITLAVSFDAEFAYRDKHAESRMFILLAAVSSGFNFTVYLLLHYRSFHSWNPLRTILNIAGGNLFFEDFSYFTESFLLCMTAAAAAGAGLRYLLKKLFLRTYGQGGLSGRCKAAVLLSVSVTAAASAACYGVRVSGISRLVINEVCSKNSSVFLDGRETASDYVELYNSGWLPYNVSGVYMSDDADDLEKYEIPCKVLKPREYQIVLLDENAPFQISDSGETIYLSCRGQLLDQIECAALGKDCSYSRLLDGGSDWGIRTCTPGKDNETSYPVLSAPVFSHESGFYADDFELEIFCEEGETIFYTLDGSVPTKFSFRYQGPIHISDASENENVWSMRKDVSNGFLDGAGYKTPDYLIDKCTVLRAVSVDKAGNESPAASAAYFVDFADKEGYQGMNIVSIITDPDNLFDYDTGIYVMGRAYDFSRDYDAKQWYADVWWWQTANYRQRGRDWEKEASLQFFDTEGKLLLAKEAGIRIQGNGSRGRVPRSFNFYARNEYDGNNRFEADFFGTQYEPQRMTLFAGSDNNLLKLKDYLAAAVVSDREFAVMDYVPYVMFLDGEYWGCYWLIEKYDEEFFAYHFNVDKDNVIVIKDSIYGKLAVGNEEDEKLYDDMYAFITESDLSVDDNYRKVCELIDVDSYIDYCAAEIYIANLDWPDNNFGLWRTRTVEDSPYSDGKWRWFLFDVNNAGVMASKNAESELFADVLKDDPMFSSMMRNDEFSREFASRILDMANKEFLPEHINAFLDEYRELMEEPLKKEYERFYGRDNDKLSKFEEELQDTRDFFEKRYVYITDYFENYARGASR